MTIRAKTLNELRDALNTLHEQNGTQTVPWDVQFLAYKDSVTDRVVYINIMDEHTVVAPSVADHR